MRIHVDQQDGSVEQKHNLLKLSIDESAELQTNEHNGQ